MAINVMCAVWDKGPSCQTELLVLLALADCADKDTGEAFPSQATLAKRARIDERSVRRVLVRLWDGGWLRWSAQKRAGGSDASNRYRLNLAKLGLAVLEHRDFSRDRRPPAKPRRLSGRTDSPTPVGLSVLRGQDPESYHVQDLGSSLEPCQLEPRTAAAPAAPQRAKPEAAALSEPGNAREGEAAARVGAVAFAENGQGEVEADALEGWSETAICALQFGLAARVGGRWLRPDDPPYGAALLAWHEREAARALA